MVGRINLRRRQARQQEETPSLLAELAQAYADWQAAQLVFAEVTDPDLVEWAAFHLKACEQQYLCLWRRARRAGLRGQVRLRA